LEGRENLRRKEKRANW